MFNWNWAYCDISTSSGNAGPRGNKLQENTMVLSQPRSCWRRRWRPPPGALAPYESTKQNVWETASWGWKERTQKKLCQPGSPWPIRLPPPAGRENAGARGEGEAVSSHLIAFCGGWYEVRALPLSDPLWFGYSHSWIGGRRCPDFNSWEKRQIRLKRVFQTPRLKWAFTL